ncbi:MAG: ABC transporter permease [Sphingobacteriales bacterium]|nr:ABC transporter permease [Sphingobacteriales bacterium]
MLLKIAWRNTWRNKKRSLIIIAAVTAGLATGIFLMAFYNGMVEERVKAAVSGEISHIQLHHPSFRSDYDADFFLDNGREKLNRIRKLPDVKWATGRVVLRGMIASAYGSSGITINGIHPGEEDRITGLSAKIMEGRYFNGEKPNELIIGEKLLKKLKLSRGHKAVISFQDTAGNIESAAFRICAVYKTANTPYDESNVFVPISDLDTLAGLPGQFNEIAVLLHASGQLETVQNTLKGEMPGTEIMNWKEIAPELGLTVTVAEQMVYIFMVIILLALAFGIVNTMLMAVLERKREIGVLLALGMNRARVFNMILAETLFLIAAGCPGGMGIAFAAIAITHRTGINLSKFADVYASFGYSPVNYPSLAPGQLLTILLLVVFTAFLSALYPAWKAIRLKPAASIRK